MSLAFSLAHLTVLPLSPPEMIDVAAQAGYAYVGLRPVAVTAEEPAYPLGTDKALLRATKQRLSATGVRVLDIELFKLVPEADLNSFLPALEAGAELGARHIIAAPWDADRNRLIERFAQLCDMAQPFGLTVNAEFVTWRETPDLAAATALVSAANRGNAAILVDTLHFARSNCELGVLRNLPREWFHFAQVCDAPPGIPATNEGLIYTARQDRRYLGEGGINVRAILDALPHGIPYSLELPNAEAVKAVGLKEHARRALITATHYLEQQPQWRAAG